MKIPICASTIYLEGDGEGWVGGCGCLKGETADSRIPGLHWTPGLHWIPRVQWSPGVHDKILHEQLLNFINYLQKNKEKI